MCVSKARGWPRSWQMPGPRAVQDLQMPHPRDWYGGQIPGSSPGGGGLGTAWSSVAPSSQGMGYSGFQVTGMFECGQKSTPPPEKKSIGFLTKPKKSLHKNYPSPLPPKKKHGKRDLVPGHRHRTRILAWVCLKKECVHISAQRVPYIGTKCERCITLPRATKETGPVCRHAGHLFHWCRIPILIKQNSLLCRHKSWRFLVCCIRRHTDIFRFILIYLIIASYVPQGVMSMSSFKQTAESGILSKVVETVLPVKAAKEEVIVEPEDETEVEDNTYVGESRSVVTE